MSTTDDLPAAEVYAIIEEPTVQTGPIRTVLLKLMAPFAGRLIPGGTHPVVVAKATGKNLRGSAAAGTGLIESMQAGRWEMSAGEFRHRHLDM